MNWLRHWALRFDPFRPGAVPYVATPEHEEAVARLVHLVEQGDRRGELRGEPGLGKSAALDEALRRLRRPGRRLLVARRPCDDMALIRGLASGFGLRLDPAVGRSEGLGRLLDAARVARAQEIGLVLAIDDDDLIRSGPDPRAVDRIEAIGRQSGAAMTLLVTGPIGPPGPDPGALAVGLRRLTRGMTAEYLGEKLRAAGRTDRAFSDRALDRLHAASLGLPAAIDRLAGLAMRAAAGDRRELVPAAVVAGVAPECVAACGPDLAPN